MFVNNLDSESVAESKVLSRKHISAMAGSAKGTGTIGTEYSNAQ